jgi:hypothetical protein
MSILPASFFSFSSKPFLTPSILAKSLHFQAQHLVIRLVTSSDCFFPVLIPAHPWGFSFLITPSAYTPLNLPVPCFQSGQSALPKGFHGILCLPCWSCLITMLLYSVSSLCISTRLWHTRGRDLI